MANKILVFGASSSKKSINRQFAIYTANLMKNIEPNILDLNDFEMPIYSIDKENENGIPDAAHKFRGHILESDGIIISFAEHNGSYTTAFKNIYDWMSRIDSKVWANKPMFLLATSPGARGGQSVLNTVVNGFPYLGGDVRASFSLPSFYQNFSSEDGILDKDLSSTFRERLSVFEGILQ